MTVATSIEVRSVKTAEDFERFLDVPQRVYANDPNWVAPLRSAIATQLSPENPFRTYGTLQAFTALEQGTPVGRIVAAINQRLIEREGQPIGLFGYFECVPKIEIAQALFQAAEQWLQTQGIQRIRGPIDLSTHNS
jgi:hypothetical protein